MEKMKRIGMYMLNKSVLVTEAEKTEKGKKIIRLNQGEKYYCIHDFNDGRHSIILCKSYEQTTVTKVKMKNCIRMDWKSFYQYFVELNNPQEHDTYKNYII